LEARFDMGVHGLAGVRVMASNKLCLKQ